MIDIPNPTAAYEQVLTQKLVDCGLHSVGFTVKYERELQSIEIVIDQGAGVNAEHFDCIRDAAGQEIVTFEDPELRQAYQDSVSEALRPKRLADARAELEKHGVLDGFPERSRFGSDKLFAEALEQHCGIKPGSFFVQSQSGLTLQPKINRQNRVERDRMSCLTAAIMYVAAKGDDFEFGFVGNEAFAPGK
jgi:hypothetical protein